MFTYWDGYEIDGSDTDFDIVLPEDIQTWEFVDCFLNMPLFSKGKKPYILLYKKGSESEESDLEDLKREILMGNEKEFSIEVNCLEVDRLTADMKKAIYKLSEGRDPYEEAFGKTENPAVMPYVQNFYTRGSLTVSFRMSKRGTNKSWYDKDVSPQEVEGYVKNAELILSDGNSLRCFSINVGPGFYYEYAMYIMNYMTDHFPGIAVCGGLDCGGGWTDGCTYACSLYCLESIVLPQFHSVKNRLKRLTEVSILSSYIDYYEKGWQYEISPDFCLVNMPDHASSAEDKPFEDDWYDYSKNRKDRLKNQMGFTQYADFCQNVLASETSEKDMLFKTAIHIFLPKPSEYKDNPKAEKVLKKALEGVEYAGNDWAFTGCMAFFKKDGETICEFRVNWKLKKYFLTLLTLAESGELDIVKKANYDKRSEE